MEEQIKLLMQMNQMMLQNTPSMGCRSPSHGVMNYFSF